MTREHTVSVRLKEGSGGVTHCAGQRYRLALMPGEVADKWADGSPITLSEFEEVLQPHGPFELAPAKTAPPRRAAEKSKEE